MSKTKHVRILIINGSIRGSKGNSGRVVRWSQDFLNKKQVDATEITLANPMPRISDVRAMLNSHDAFLCVSGNYWNSWGSLIQRFLEVMTFCENGSEFFGKPFACAVTMDSVGGTEVAARLHAAFSGLGCWSPPCSTVVISRVAEEAIKASMGAEEDPNEDVWRLDDLEIVLDNLIASCKIKPVNWGSWPSHELLEIDGAWPDSGPLDLGSTKFL